MAKKEKDVTVKAVEPTPQIETPTPTNSFGEALAVFEDAEQKLIAIWKRTKGYGNSLEATSLQNRIQRLFIDPLDDVLKEARRDKREVVNRGQKEAIILDIQRISEFKKDPILQEIAEIAETQLYHEREAETAELEHAHILAQAETKTARGGEQVKPANAPALLEKADKLKELIQKAKNALSELAKRVQNGAEKIAAFFDRVQNSGLWDKLFSGLQNGAAILHAFSEFIQQQTSKGEAYKA